MCESLQRGVRAQILLVQADLRPAFLLETTHRQFNKIKPLLEGLSFLEVSAGFLIFKPEQEPEIRRQLDSSNPDYNRHEALSKVLGYVCAGDLETIHAQKAVYAFQVRLGTETLFGNIGYKKEHVPLLKKQFKKMRNYLQQHGMEIDSDFYYL